MKIFSGQGCLIFLVIAFTIAGFEAGKENPLIWAIMAVAIVSMILAYFALRRKEQSSYLVKMEQMADSLDQMAESGFGGDEIIFATEKGEEVVLRISGVGLKEFRSSGSTYGGGYGGLSFKVSKGIRANVGGMKGGSTKKPEESTLLDIGQVTFTNKRIVFTGDNMVAEFQLDKIVNLETGPNGIQLEISVSNRPKTAVLEAANYPELTPGMAADLALTWQKGGKKEAQAQAKVLAERIRSMVAEESSGK
jgi:hypothetical protein